MLKRVMPIFLTTRVSVSILPSAGLLFMPAFVPNG